MQLKVNLDMEQLLALIAQLPDEDKRKLVRELHKWTPMQQPHALPLRELRPFGVLKGKVWMSEDFDAPLDDFKNSRTYHS